MTVSTYLNSLYNFSYINTEKLLIIWLKYLTTLQVELFCRTSGSSFTYMPYESHVCDFAIAFTVNVSDCDIRREEVCTIVDYGDNSYQTSFH